VARLRGEGTAVVFAAAPLGRGVDQFRQALLEAAPADFFESRALVADLVPEGRIAVLVVPIDKEAPKGRIILPQVQAIRDLLDGDAACVVVKERQLARVLAGLREPPALVVTDSQAFAEVARQVPPEIPLTSFSILMARFQGDLVEQVRGTLAIDGLKGGDRVLVAESCTHHPIGEDIGRVKIPKWLNGYVGGELGFDTVQGRDFPDDLSGWSLVVHCGSCMGNRREMLSRILKCRTAGVPITNYGLTIAYSLGLFERALGPFPAALEAYRSARAAPVAGPSR
jgi:[FeFe] hydrogenase H-cluster maturation GTPase HydF